MRRQPDPYGHPLRQHSPPTPPTWAHRDRPSAPDRIGPLSNDQLEQALVDAGVRPLVARHLVEDRDTAGAAWRITQELEL